MVVEQDDINLDPFLNGGCLDLCAPRIGRKVSTRLDRFRSRFACVFPGQHSVVGKVLDTQEVTGSIPVRPTA